MRLLSAPRHHRRDFQRVRGRAQGGVTLFLKQGEIAVDLSGGDPRHLSIALASLAFPATVNHFVSNAEQLRNSLLVRLGVTHL